MELTCIKTCTTPFHGKVLEDDKREFPIEKWDLQAFPYLKHFARPKHIKDEMEAELAGESLADKPPAIDHGGSDPLLGIKFSEITEEQLADIKTKELAQSILSRYKITVASVGVNKASVLAKAIEIESKE